MAHRFARDIANATNFDLTVSSAGTQTRNVIILKRDASLGPEAYHLDVSSSAVTIRAAEPAGAFYALETLKQLLPAAIYRDAPVAGTNWNIPAVHIEDAPRF